MITPEQLASSGSEHGAQAAIFCWSALPEVRAKYPVLKYLFAVPNGFYGSAAQKGKMKAEGLKLGVPDIILPVVKTINNSLDKSTGLLKYAGLFIELKVGNNKPSPEQLDWLAF